MDRALADAASLISQILADTIEKFLASEGIVSQEPTVTQTSSAEPTLALNALGPVDVSSSSAEQSEPAATESEPTIRDEPPSKLVQSHPDGVGFMSAIPSVDSEMAANLVDRVLRDALSDVADEEQQMLAHPHGAEASLHDFKPVEPFYRDLPLPISRQIVSDSLSIISVKHDADLDQAADYPAMRNSFRSLIHPDVSRIQRLMVSN